MTKEISSRVELQAQIIKSLAHPTRLYIVQRIQKDEICMCQLAAEIGADITTVSKHVSLLKKAGIIRVEKRANMIFPKLKCNQIKDFFSFIDSVLETNHSEMSQALQ